MQTTLDAELIGSLTEGLRAALTRDAERFPGDSHRRQPVHTVYGGAQLFSAETPAKLGRLAAAAFDEYAGDPSVLASVLGIPGELSGVVHERVREKLAREPVEDLRIDFEDGYGIRPDDEEDAHAVSTADEMAKALASGALPPFVGIRVKAMSAEAHGRSIRTLDLFLTRLTEAAGRLPDNFLITLPKVVLAEQVSAFADVVVNASVAPSASIGTTKRRYRQDTLRSLSRAIGSRGRLSP